MASLILKVKTRKGQYVLENLNANSTINNLKSRISDLTKISQQEIFILIGFPPKPLNLSNGESSLKELGICNGETLIVDIQSSITAEPIITSNTETVKECRQNLIDEDGLFAQSISGQDPTGDCGILLKKVVPSDNSCLFTSIGYVLNGKIESDSTLMRQIIAQQVANDKETYSDAFLGKPNEEYCEWIQKPETWGGAIEVSILSSFYGVEIDVIDVTNALINRFGEDRKYGIRVFLLFDGVHYDPLYLEPLTDDASPKTMFPIEDESVYKQAEQIAIEAKSSRQFTDVNKFTLKCIDCDSFLVGQIEAQQHAFATGHTNFGEV